MDLVKLQLRRFVGAGLVLFSLLGAVAAPIPQRWVATSNTAMSITGDARFTANAIGFAGGRLSIQFLKWVPAKVSFAPSSPPKARAELYRVLSKNDLILKNHNFLCGQRPTYVSVLFLHSAYATDAFLTVYSGAAEPTGASTDKICAGYSYSVLPAH